MVVLAPTWAVGPLIDQLAVGAFQAVADSLVGEQVADNLVVADAQTSVEDRALESVVGQGVQISGLAIDQTWVLVELVVFPEQAALDKGANDLVWGQVTPMLAISEIGIRMLEILETMQATLETLVTTMPMSGISVIETRTSATLGTTMLT